ncbi:MAG: Rho GTPase [Chaenotheca gracillima]|nr:MAG: Rho GTPase [Chaenotheca gracillima]
MPVPVGAVPSGGGRQGPSLFDKMKMGAMMGGSVGLIIGFIFGSVNIIRYGAGANGIMRSLGQYMAGSAATFGFASPAHHLPSKHFLLPWHRIRMLMS